MESETDVTDTSEQPFVHTPGPWKVANNSRSVLAGQVKINQQAGPAAQSASVEARNEFTLRANAKLVAAAPDMLAAIRGALRIADLWAPSDAPQEHFEESRALYLMLRSFEEIARTQIVCASGESGEAECSEKTNEGTQSECDDLTAQIRAVVKSGYLPDGDHPNMPTIAWLRSIIGESKTQ